MKARLTYLIWCDFAFFFFFFLWCMRAPEVSKRQVKLVHHSPRIIFTFTMTFTWHSWILQQIQWIPCKLSKWWIWRAINLQHYYYWSIICNICSINLFCFPLSAYGEAKLLQASRILGSIGIKWGIGFKWDRLL